jgi:hypothetical protein
MTVHGAGDHETFESERLRPEHRLAVDGLVDGLEIVERAPEALHKEEHEGTEEDGADDEKPEPLVSTGTGRRTGTVL